MTTKEKPIDELHLEDQSQLVREKRLLSFLMSNKIPPIPEEDERREFPEKKVNIIYRAMFWWLNPIMKTGYKRTVHDKDLFYLSDDIKSETMYNKFRSYLDKYMKEEIHQFLTEKYKKEGKTYDPEAGFDDKLLEGFEFSTLLIPKCLYFTLFLDYNTGIILKIFWDSTNATIPLLQRKLIDFVEYRALDLHPAIGKGVGYAIGCCLMILFSALTINGGFYCLQISGAKTRAILTRLLLDKSLSVGAKGNHLFAASKVQSMISTDINRIDLAIGFAPFLFTSPIPIAISIGLLIWNIGVSSLVGIGIFILNVVFLGSCIKRLLGLRVSASKFTDTRVNLMKELLKSYKMIKFYSWEDSYRERIQKARFSEMALLLKLQSLRNVLISISLAMPGIASMATFCTAYSVSSGKPAANIFSSLSLFQVLAIQFMLTPMALAMSTDLIVSVKKINKFLVCSDFNPKQFEIEKFNDENIAFKIENGDFEWVTFDEENNDDSKESKAAEHKTDDGADSNTETHSASSKSTEKSIANEEKGVEKTAFPGLHDINFDIKKGEFVVVTGVIGSGKSSLLNAMAGLMKKTNGHVYADGDLLLCGYPWVQNATIRENITFGLPFDEKKYCKIVEACSLISDFKQFTGGDMTEVGERGITLSGGQKARINLARAVYADKDIILLDDVLSAVDAKVGKHIVENCILGLLKDKTRIMATHQLGLIDSADRMIFLNGDGTIDIGPIDELKSRNQKLVNLLNYQIEDKEQDEEFLDEMLEYDHQSVSESMEYDPNEEERQLKEQEIELKLTKPLTENGKLEENDLVKIIGDEERAVNSLKIDVYLNYCKLAFRNHPYLYPVLFLSFAVISTFCNYFTSTWLSFWVDQKFPGRPAHFYMGIYIMFAFLYAFFLSAFTYLMTFFSNNAATMLNYRASGKILHVPMSFMDVSPLGRVLNRFTKDTDTVDNDLVEEIRQFMTPLCNTCGTIILCIIYIPWFAIAVPLIIIFYMCCANYYQASAREVKRLEAVKRSNVYSHFNEVLSGKETMKAYKKEIEVKDKLSDYINLHNEAYFITIANQRWLGAQLSILSFCIVVIISLLCVFRVFKINAASTGLLLTYVINVTNMLTMMMRALTQVENEFNSVERLNHYAFDIAQEAAFEIPETEPSPDWPQFGEINFTNVNMKYRPELPYVLKDLNIHINKNEKIGFCGRTGAGKSTFMTCLYRLTEFEGDITIDGIDISKLGLHSLRSKLTIIPQDPVLFVGTIRENLDPFEQYDDEKLWKALCISGLIKPGDVEKVKNQSKDDENLHKFHLRRVVEDDGSNFSIGERQLIALARALVRKTKILILDEATSSVDYETDSKIQSTISTEFSDCTILCIAHRLNTIINYDRIVVMDQGRVIEFDSPKKLFLNENSAFRNMCDQAKITLDDFKKK